MRVFPVLADAARPGTTGNVSMLNGGWAFTTAAPIPSPGTGWTLPAQALVVFVEAEWPELNRPQDVVIGLLDEDAEHVSLRNEGQTTPARITTSVTVPSTAGAPNGTPGRAHLLVDLGGGSLQIKRAPARLIWKVAVGTEAAEIGFWVNAPPSQPKIGL